MKEEVSRWAHIQKGESSYTKCDIQCHSLFILHSVISFFRIGVFFNM